MRAKKTIFLLGMLGALALGFYYIVPPEPRNFEAQKTNLFYREIATPFVHHYRAGNNFIFSTAAVIDIDNDGRQEIFVGGGEGDDDLLLALKGDALVALPEGAQLSDKSTTYGATAADINGDGLSDLIVARNRGVSIYYNEGGVFRVQHLALPIAAESFALGASPADYDKDGDVDLYVSVFVDADNFISATFNDPAHAKPNLLLQNNGTRENGDIVFSNIAIATMTDSGQNTFAGLWVDLDLDQRLDLVLAQNTSRMVVFHNQAQGFVRKDLPTGYGFWMSASAGDIDNDGDLDLFASNSGNSIARVLIRGDLRDDQRLNADWVLLRNDGDFSFSETTKEANVGGYGFGWGGVFEDYDGNGTLDLLVAQNYIKWPFFACCGKLPGKLLLNDGAGVFYEARDTALANRHYGQSPIIADLNNDGRQDVLWLNMDGPLRAFINEGEGNFLTLRLGDDARLIGTRAYVETEAGRSYTRYLMNNIGIATDQSADLFFGLGEARAVERLVILYPDGARREIDNPDMNQILVID